MKILFVRPSRVKLSPAQRRADMRRFLSEAKASGGLRRSGTLVVVRRESGGVLSKALPATRLRPAVTEAAQQQHAELLRQAAERHRVALGLSDAAIDRMLEHPRAWASVIERRAVRKMPMAWQQQYAEAARQAPVGWQGGRELRKSHPGPLVFASPESIDRARKVRAARRLQERPILFINAVVKGNASKP